MKAIIAHRYGSPDILSMQEMKNPACNSNDILIKNIASTVNRTDCALLRAKPLISRLFTGLFSPKKKITGTVFAGTVVSKGDDVKGFDIGDKVFGFDDTGLCSHAEFIARPISSAILKIPVSVSFQYAAASIEGFHYALNMVNKIELKKGQHALVIGATGAIGSAVLQLLNYYGVHVTAVCEGENEKIVQSIGADIVVDYMTEDFTKELIKYDLIFDAVGKSSFGKCKPVLNKRGVYISTELGKMGQNIFYTLFTPMSSGKKVIFPYPRDIQKSLDFVSKLLGEKKFEPLIDKIFSFQEIPQAYKYVERGMKTGNVIIAVSE